MQDQETTAPEITDEQAEVLDKLAETEDATGEEEAEEKKFSQAELDHIVAERLEREKKQREKAATKAREDAEAKALEEQKEFHELAEKRKKKIEDLEAEVARLSEVETRTEKYEGALTQRLEAEMDGVPDYIKNLLEGRDPVDQLNWLTENREAIGAPTQDIPGSPPAGDPSQLTDEKRKEQAEIASRQLHRAF